ncbi:MAG TPA: hypothetical protein VFO39_16520 [Candidatus Sulfotelmatobacter sp.]|nr:hypothetical protein [Candidatus Sulfotelmatobacter sp.]
MYLHTESVKAASHDAVACARQSEEWCRMGGRFKSTDPNVQVCNQFPACTLKSMVADIDRFCLSSGMAAVGNEDEDNKSMNDHEREQDDI